MYKQEPYLSEYIDVRAGVYFKPFYNVLADCGVRKLKSSLTDMRETYSEYLCGFYTVSGGTITRNLYENINCRNAYMQISRETEGRK